MNYRKGFFRLWVAASVVWVVGFLGLVAVYDGPGRLLVVWYSPDWYIPYGIVFGTPFAVLLAAHVLVWTARWIVQGFKIEGGVK